MEVPLGGSGGPTGPAGFRGTRAPATAPRGQNPTARWGRSPTPLLDRQASKGTEWGALLVADEPGQMPAGGACAWLGEPPLRPLPPHSAASPGRLHVRP